MGKLLNDIGGTNVSKTVKNTEDGSKTMSTIKPGLGPGLGSLIDQNRGKIFPNIKYNKDKTLDKLFEKNLILFSKENFDQDIIENISCEKFKDLTGILESFDSEALILFSLT